MPFFCLGVFEREALLDTLLITNSPLPAHAIMRISKTRHRSPAPSLTLFALYCIFCSSVASAADIINSSGLKPCEGDENPGFTARLFEVAFTPNNKSLSVDMAGVSSIDGNITASIALYAYGKDVLSSSIDLCDLDIPYLCPMTPGPVTLRDSFPDLQNYTNHVPRIAYQAPDLDLVARMRVSRTETDEDLACIETSLSNDKTVYKPGVGWTSACTVGLGLMISAAAHLLEHPQAAAHVVANTMLLLAFFQSQAMLGMMSVPLPPIVQSWTQNMQWSMGIIRAGFLQTLATWYMRATGGKSGAATSPLHKSPVQAMKDGSDLDDWDAPEISPSEGNHDNLAKRVAETIPSTAPNDLGALRGMQRVGVKAGIERSNIFLTGLIFFIILVIFVALFVALFKLFCEVAEERRWIKRDEFRGFRSAWKVVLRGILYRLVRNLGLHHAP